MIEDIPDYLTAESDAENAQASIEDYGKADDGPYQVVNPAYPAPQWLGRFIALGPALRECDTLCTLKGRPFRVVRWGREGSGNRGGIPCATCASHARIPRWPRRLGAGFLRGFPRAMPVAEARPGGQWVVYDSSGNPKLVGEPSYVVSHTPFPRFYEPEVYPQRYLEAVKTAQVFANQTGKRAYLCSSFGADCEGKRKTWIPVVYVDPGGLDHRYSNVRENEVLVTPVSSEHFQELVERSRGGTYLGQGA